MGVRTCLWPDPWEQMGARCRWLRAPVEVREGIATVAVVTPEPAPHDAGDDAARLAELAHVLADAVDAAIGPWVQRCVAAVAEAWQPGLAARLAPAATAAGEEATRDVGARVRALLEADVDQQATGPLALLREAVRYPTAVLAEAGVPTVARDEFAERAFPGDAYGLAPAAFADVDPALHEPGLVWGAAKAHVVLARRRADGRR